MSGFSGMKAWIIQRFTGIYIALFILLMGFTLLTSGPINYSLWTALFSQPFLQVTSGLFIIALLYHAWIGLRDVVLDYVHPIGIKMVVLSAIAIALLSSGLWFFRALLTV